MKLYIKYCIEDFDKFKSEKLEVSDEKEKKAIEIVNRFLRKRPTDNKIEHPGTGYNIAVFELNGFFWSLEYNSDKEINDLIARIRYRLEFIAN